jgi:hypothetical protein
MNNYLHGLPFAAGPASASDCNCPGQAFDPVDFKLYSQDDRLPTFVLRLPAMGENPDLTYAAECIRVFTCDGKEMVRSITMEEAGIRIVKDTASYYLTYDGSIIEGIKLECGKCYRLKIMSFWSELFWVTDIPQSKVLIELSNKSQLGDVPYQAPLNFVQKILLDGDICSLDAELFQNKKTDANGNETATFQRMTTRKKLTISSAPEFIEQIAKSIELHNNFTVSQKGITHTPIPGRTTVESSQLDCCRYDLNITLPLRDVNILGGVCQSDAQGTLVEVDIPDELPDSCEVDGDWEYTDDPPLCLKIGEVPPPITPPITPVGTPPVGAPCPPEGTVVNSNTQTVSCENAFIFEGLRYKKKVTKSIADGSCGTTPEVQYVDQCQDDLVVHTISNVVCQNVIPVPPVGTPPVGTPPVGTPPVGTPPVGTPPPVGTIGTNYGAFNTKVNGRYYTYSKAPKFDIQFNSDGTISDVTPGLITTGSVNIQDGQNVFYMQDYLALRNEDGTAFKMQNAYFPDMIMTLRKFVMNPTKFPDQAAFDANESDSGYDTTGVNMKNGYVAEVFMSITSDIKQGTGLAPKGLTVSRINNFLDFTPNQDWAAYNKYCAVTWMNKGDSQASFIQKGVLPNTLLGQGPQPQTWLTFKNGQNEVKTAEQLYDQGRATMWLLGSSPRSIYTSEYIENEQGQGPGNEFFRTAQAYRGAFDVITENHPGTNVKNTGLFGEYGSDDYYGLFAKGILKASRADYELYLTDNIYKSHGINGFGAGTHEYFTQGQINYRNLNSRYYFYQRKYHYVYEFLTWNEKTKLSTKTYDGQDRERSWAVFTATSIENMAIDNTGSKVGIEQTRTGEIIPYPNGELLTRLNTQPPMPWGAAFDVGIWGTLLSSAVINWDAPNSLLGSDQSKVNWYSDQQVQWRPTGSGSWEPYVPGQNGAPANSSDGLKNSLFSSVTDALIAGRNALWAIRDRMQNLRHVPYTSSRGGFSPTPGQAGYHLNGHGPVNWGQFTARDIYDNKVGAAIRGDGMVIYKNEYLPANTKTM